MIKSFFKRLLFVIGVIVLVYCCVEHLFPTQTQHCINQIYHYINNSPDEDTIQLSLDENNRLYNINAEINGIEMTFILDTGCSCILMSQVELAYLMRRGAISEYDYLGKISSRNADGVESTIDMYNIKTLVIGDYILNNIQCGISNEPSALLLLGQDVLSKFTNVTINYSNHTLKLEK